MAFVYPERLIPSKDKISKLVFCEYCYLCRRSIDKSMMLDDDGELEIAAIQIDRIFNYSLNLVNCGKHHSDLTVAADVLIEVDQTEFTKKDFTGDDSLVPQSKDITGRIADEKGFFLLASKAIEEIKATFPFKKDPKKEEKTFHLELKSVHRPNLINISHFEIECWSDFGGEFSRVKPDRIKEDSYREKIAHIVRDAIQNLKDPDIQIFTGSPK